MKFTGFGGSGGNGCGCCGGSPPITCSPCNIPATNLTVSWTNPTLGNGSTTLVYSSLGGTNVWRSGCSNNLIYTLQCRTGQVEFIVTYFVTGSCPSGTPNSCSSLGSPPNQLILNSHTCSPFMFQWRETTISCPAVAGLGFITWTVTP